MSKPKVRGCGCDGEKCRVPKGDPRHGLSGTYRNHGCHCTRCRRAWSKYWNTWVTKDPVRYAREKKRRRLRYLAKKAERKKVAA